ncbi:MAG: hypothetical protein H6922_01295 [Pseudomonadaceae bacterium]|nr:hypothetical protein [Pseudomonadaceae bacterium]
MSDIPLPKLADNRSTQRLLNIVRQLEDHMANLHSAGGEVAAMPVEGELARLRGENKELKTRQRHALSRLDDLISRMESLPDNSQESAAA